MSNEKDYAALKAENEQLMSDIKGLCNLCGKLIRGSHSDADVYYLNILLKRCSDEYGA